MYRENSRASRPSRRRILTGAVGAGAALSLSPLAGLAAAGEGPEANILLAVCDALRADRLGCYGYRRRLPDGTVGSPTPFIDRLAAGGVVFENCIAQSSWTQTSMASMLYSAWPVIKGDFHGFAYFPRDSHALEEATPGLKRFGIQANPYLKSPCFRDRFEVYKFVKDKEYAPAALLNDTFDWHVTPPVRRGEKFLCYIHYMEPHEPYIYEHDFRGAFTPEGWRYVHPSGVNDMLLSSNDRNGRVRRPPPDRLALQLEGTSRAYDEDVMSLDRELEDLFNWLDELGVREETIVIFTSDHGQAFGEHGWCGHKVTLYQEEIHIPLIIAGPGIPAGERVTAQVRGVDVVPTLAALAGRSVSGLVGRPLLPASRVEAAGNRPAYSCCDFARYGEAERLLTCLLTPEREKYIRVAQKDHTLLREELYDLAADPHERKDLAGDSPERLKELSRRMDALEAANYWRHDAAKSEQVDEETEKQLRSLGYLQ